MLCVSFLFLFRACTSCVLWFSTVFCVSSPVFQLLCLVRGCLGAGHSVCWSLLGDWLIRVEDVLSVFGLCDVVIFPLCGSCFLFCPSFFPAVVVLSLVCRSSCQPLPRPCVLWTAVQSSLMAVAASVAVRARMHFGGHAAPFSVVESEERGPKARVPRPKSYSKARKEGRRPDFRGRNHTQKRGRRAEGPTSEVETEVDRSLLCESAPPPCHMSNRVEPYPSTRGSVHGITLPPAGATTRRRRCLTIYTFI